MALIPDPALLILDEPTQGMDVEGRRTFWQQVRSDAQAGRTIPLSQLSHPLRTMAAFTPLWSLNGLAHYPLAAGSFNWSWVGNLIAWLITFTAGAAWRFSKDTARV
jgi:hypothetical protein